MAASSPKWRDYLQMAGTVDVNQVVSLVRADFKPALDEISNKFSHLNDTFGGMRQEVRQEMSEMRQEMRQEMSEMRQEMRQEMSEMRQEMRQDISEMRQEMRQDISDVQHQINDVNNIVNNLQSSVQIESAKTANSRVSPHESLHKVPHVNGEIPPDDLWPANFATLSVGGSELVPGQTSKVEWSNQKSLALLQWYGDYDTDDEGNTDTKVAASSLRRRRVLAQRIGVSSRQLSDAAGLSFVM